MTGQERGITARNYGTGDLSVTTASVTGTTSDGLFAYNSADSAGVALDSSAGAIVGETGGVRVNNFGTGALQITSGDVTGNQGAGIDATNSADSAGVSLTIDGSVTGATSGVRIDNTGSVNTAIVNNGTIGATSG